MSYRRRLGSSKPALTGHFTAPGERLELSTNGLTDRSCRNAITGVNGRHPLSIRPFRWSFVAGGAHRLASKRVLYAS
jgi:hypothetical protein